MADNRIILIAADIAMHKFHIARAKALPGCKHRHCLERSNPPNRCHSWRLWRLMVLVILLSFALLQGGQNTKPSERGRSHGSGDLIGIVVGSG
ncbi:hypothetical protein [Mesorhizobium sp.]|uniref:hypothetical protein n=1 Tax=Mesorhizobium sp. TaxID=1871066 RepID=UPI000FE9A582|nr:hypothetical protein [Mesorhizobium sp.]RWP02702.1 MAG: hypothetical protein EOQ99_22680 [Mesorhizobium sp.]